MSGWLSSCSASDTPILRTVSGPTTEVCRMAIESLRARSPGKTSNSSAARFTGNFDNKMAPTSGASFTRIGSNFSGGRSAMICHGSPDIGTPERLRTRCAALGLMCDSNKPNASPNPRGKDRPIESIVAKNSSVTAFSVARSMDCISASCCVRSSCMPSGKSPIGTSTPSDKSSRTMTAAFCRFVSFRGADKSARAVDMVRHRSGQATRKRAKL